MSEPMTEQTMQQIADDLRAGFEAGPWHEVLIPILADVVDVEHHPTRGATDGPTPRARLVAEMRAHDHHGMLADARQILHELTVAGNVITAVQTFEATVVESGRRISMPLTEAFTFRDGLLVAIDHYTNPADTDELLAARG